MDFDQTCLDFLDHFDRPKTADSVEFESPPSVGFDPTSINLEYDVAQACRHLPTRGVRWVLQWAGALTVLGVAASVLTQFAYLVAAEHTLNVAARAGAAEAMLPRATYQSISAAVERRLASYPQLSGQLELSVLQNGSPIGGRFRTGDGDRFSVTLTAPTSAVIPGWLRRLSFWRGDTPINAQAERQLPGRKLRVTQS